MTTDVIFPVPKGWRRLTVDDIKSSEKSSCAAGPFGSKISSKYFVDEGVPIIRGNNLRDDLTRFVPEGFAFVSDDQARQYGPQHVRGGDLIFTCWGTIGQVGIIPNDGPFPEYIISNKQLKLRVNTDIVEPLFCFYYLASPAGATYIRNRGIGGAIPGINLGILKAMPIAIPKREVQRGIVAVLSAYDDLIENNRRRMALLEESARLLYQEWFVRLRFPGHEHVRVKNGIPDGWEQKPLQEICPDLREAAHPADLEPGTPYIGLEHIPRRSITLLEWGTVGEVTSTKIRYRAGDILFGKIRPYFHKVGFAITDGVASSDAIVLRPIDPAYYSFSLLTVSSDWFVTIVSKTAKEGSKMPRADWNLMETHLLAVPPLGILESLNETVRPMLDQLRTLAFQNQKLRAARDLLLPRLMSGEVAV